MERFNIAVSKPESDVAAHDVNGSGMSTQSWGGARDPGGVVSYNNRLRPVSQKAQVFIPISLSLPINLCGIVVLKAELKCFKSILA